MLPVIARKLVYPMHERLMRRPTFDYVASLEESQWLSRGEVERLQMDKLTQLLRGAKAHSPWHARRLMDANIDPDTGEVSLADLRRLPTMSKQDARENVERIAWRGVPGGAFKYNTGGSSGQPLIFYYGRWRQASDAAGRIRARRWWGVDVGEREVYLWGAPVELNKTDRIKTIRDRLLNQLVLNAFEMSPRQMDAYVEAIRVFRPKCIYGYASSVALLAAHASERGLDLRVPGLRVVCTTGEPLYPHQRELIGRTFGVPVANEFGSRDIGFTAHETPEGQMLLMSESIILEVLREDGSPAAPGETGEAVMTGLCSEAQPFIRYRTGDMLKLSPSPCKEGRGLHVIDEVLGRSTDFVVRGDGTIMHALAVIYVLRAVEGVGEFKIIQHATDRIEVLVAPGRGWTEQARSAITHGLRARLGANVRVETRVLDAIPAEASGKHRYVVSHVPLTGGLAAASTVEATTTDIS
jgi:phenylacetate-CoA ligase